MKTLFFYDGLIIVILFTLSVNVNVNATPFKNWFAQANVFYEKQEFDSAVLYYEKIITGGLHNSTIYFNLANSYFRLNKLGLAILNYEKARKLSPNDKDIITNLQFTQLNIIDRIPEPKRTFFENFLWYIHTMFPLTLQMWILFLLLLIMSVAFAFALFASHNARLWLIYTISLCFIVSILFGSSIGLKIYNAEKKKFAIVLKKTVDAKNAPNGDIILFTVHEGTKFQIRKTVDNWSLVNLPNGVSGWVENDLLGHI
jgi:tetratricopeptide (TPR) repeat protein